MNGGLRRAAALQGSASACHRFCRRAATDGRRGFQPIRLGGPNHNTPSPPSSLPGWNDRWSAQSKSFSGVRPHLIERLWKFTKRRSLYGRYHPTFADFRAAIEQTLTDIPNQHAVDLAALMTLNFQTFENVSLMAA